MLIFNYNNRTQVNSYLIQPKIKDQIIVSEKIIEKKSIHRIAMQRYSSYIHAMKATELLKGTLSTIILKLLADGDKMYGYEITQRVKALSNEKILLKEGSLYPALHKLLHDGLVEEETIHIGKRVRKYYRITQKGQVQKQAQFEELQEFLQTIQQLIFPQFDLKVQ